MDNYSFTQKFLHDIVLSNNFVNKSLFELEKLIYLKNIDIKYQNHVFISGLPRSGTTSILNFLYSSNHYASLTYKNMPFVLSPHLSKLINNNNIKKKERLHRDGIDYDINSPEALDEIFFNNNEEFIKSELVSYIKLILLSEKKFKYISKNNLNFKRFNLIKIMFPNSFFLIPIREPLQHAYSLLNQHLHFKKLQQKNNFIRRYMKYLRHNEFGLDHKSWNQPIYFKNFDNINYWLEQWFLFYQNILNKYQFDNNCFFIIYEKLINSRNVEFLLEKINFNNNYTNLSLNYFKNSNKDKIDIEYSKNIYQKAIKIYDDFNTIYNS